MWYPNDMFHYMFKGEFVTLVSLKVPSGRGSPFSPHSAIRVPKRSRPMKEGEERKVGKKADKKKKHVQSNKKVKPNLSLFPQIRADWTPQKPLGSLRVTCAPPPPPCTQR